jgi:hypothetical protein
MKPLGHFILFACGVITLLAGCRPPGIPFVNGPSFNGPSLSGPTFSPPSLAPPRPPSIPGPPGLPQPPSPW